MKKILVFIPIIFKLFVSPSFSFEVNMKSEEMLRLESDFLIKDLSVGDKMTLEHWDFCVSQNKLATLDVRWMVHSGYAKIYYLYCLHRRHL